MSAPQTKKKNRPDSSCAEPRQPGARTLNSCAQSVSGMASPKRVSRKGDFMLWPEDILTYRALTKHFSGKCMGKNVDLLHDSVFQISRYPERDVYAPDWYIFLDAFFL
jgi:hypothetical protein